MNEQLRRTVRAHAIEWRADVLADVAELVADGAGGVKIILPLAASPGFSDFGVQAAR